VKEGTSKGLAMLTCSHCDGFVPTQLDACPHCDAARTHETSTVGKVVQGVAAAAGTAAMMATLMACYGAGYDDMPDPGPGACETITEIPADGFVSGDTTTEASASYAMSGSCGGESTPERVFHFEPEAAEFGTAGTLTVFWQADVASTVYVLDDCIDAGELACDGGENSGTITVEIDSFEGVDVVFDGSGGYQIQVSFDTTQAPL
jgi:hypothetical protein